MAQSARSIDEIKQLQKAKAIARYIIRHQSTLEEASNFNHCSILQLMQNLCKLESSSSSEDRALYKKALSTADKAVSRQSLNFAKEIATYMIDNNATMVMAAKFFETNHLSISHRIYSLVHSKEYELQELGKAALAASKTGKQLNNPK